jgi:Beta/Gamma crystallin
MKRFPVIAAAIGSLAIGAAQAQVTLYKGHNFHGPSQEVRGEVAHLEGGFDGQASSMVIHDGTWQFCTGDHFTGRCKVLTKGSYPDLRWMDDRITSIKWLGDTGDFARYDTWEKRADARDDRYDTRTWRDRDAATARPDDRRYEDRRYNTDEERGWSYDRR